MKTSLVTFFAVSMFLLTGTTLQAASDRVAPAAGYGSHDYVLRQTPYSDGVFYAAGLEVVYAHVSGSSDGRLTRCFLHVEAHDRGDTIRVALYDYQGNYHLTLCEVDPPSGVLPQTVKLDPEKNQVWFSYTSFDNSSDRFYTVDWNPTLSSYPAPATFQFQLNGNWEVEWSTDGNSWDNGTGPGQGGRPFFSATGGGWGNPNAIWVSDGEDVTKVIEIGGNGSGFAFDNKGNLWLGTVKYTGGPEKLLMWAAEDLDNAADSGGAIVLGVAGEPGAPAWGPTVSLNLPQVTTDAFFVPSDVECDPDGNVYMSMNSPFGVPSLIFAHEVLFVGNDGVAPWPGQEDIFMLAEASVVGSDKGFRALAYDGKTHIDAGGVSQPPWDMASGNRLYVDMDYALSSDNPDEVAGLCSAEDTDDDGIPDGLDNCWQTPNPDQADTNHDGQGDVCAGDCDGSGRVDELDVPCIAQDYGRANCSPETPCLVDVDGDGDVDGMDLAYIATNLIGYYLISPPSVVEGP